MGQDGEKSSNSDDLQDLISFLIYKRVIAECWRDLLLERYVTPLSLKALFVSRGIGVSAIATDEVKNIEFK